MASRDFIWILLELRNYDEDRRMHDARRRAAAVPNFDSASREL